jgi:hypothetical protein
MLDGARSEGEASATECRTSVGDDGLLGSMTCRPQEDTRRHAWTRARTARLSALAHFASTFGPGMGPADRAYLFGLGRWVAFSLFYPRGRVRTRGIRLGRPAKNALRGHKTLDQLRKTRVKSERVKVERFIRLA